jgi:hypothetical protein
VPTNRIGFKTLYHSVLLIGTERGSGSKFRTFKDSSEIGMKPWLARTLKRVLYSVDSDSPIGPMKLPQAHARISRPRWASRQRGLADRRRKRRPCRASPKWALVTTPTNCRAAKPSQCSLTLSLHSEPRQSNWPQQGGMSCWRVPRRGSDVACELPRVKGATSGCCYTRDIRTRLWLQIKALDSYRKNERISRAEAVRRAVAAFLRHGRGRKTYAR